MSKKHLCAECQEKEAEYRLSITNLDGEVMYTEYLCGKCAWNKYPSEIPMPPMESVMKGKDNG